MPVLCHNRFMLELPSPCLVVLVGAAGSGKTTWAQQHLAAQVVSSDAMRALVGEGEHDLRASVDAFDVVERRRTAVAPGSDNRHRLAGQ